MTEEQKQEIQVRAEIIHHSHHAPGRCAANCWLFGLIHQAVSAGWHLGWADREITEGKAVVERDEIITVARKALEAAERMLGAVEQSRAGTVHEELALVRAALAKVRP